MKTFSPVSFKRIVSALKLDLSGKRVLTEAATGAYAVTAVIAAYSGAETAVFARDSAYGTAEDAYRAVFDLAETMGCRNRISIWNGSSGGFDIITNSGHLRKLGQDKLDLLHSGGVVPLMYENWELRNEDIDLNYCRQRDIPVVGVNERHPDVDVFGFLGDMAAKLAFDAGRSLYRSRALILTNNAFGPYIARSWAKQVLKLYVIGASSAEYRNIAGVDYLGDFSGGAFSLPEPVDIILYTAVPFSRRLLGYNLDEGLNLRHLEDQRDSAVFLRFCGHVETQDLDRSGIPYHPAHVKPGHMGVLPSDLGMEPVIRLQSGGLKAAELYLRGETEYKGVPLATPVML